MSPGLNSKNNAKSYLQYLPLPKYELLKWGISKEFIPYINERNRVGKTLIEENRELTYSPEGKSKK